LPLRFNFIIEVKMAAGVAGSPADYEEMEEGEEEGDIILEVSADGEAMEDGEVSEHEEAPKVLE
jgi:hypothetical protein